MRAMVGACEVEPSLENHFFGLASKAIWITFWRRS